MQLDHDVLVRLYRSRDFIADRFDSHIALGDVAAEACISPFHFHRLFVRAFGQTPLDFLTERRLDRAKELLLTTNLTVTEICFELGYSSLGTFSSRFTKEVGLTPVQYRLGSARFYQLSGFWTHRFIPRCMTLGAMKGSLPARP